VYRFQLALEAPFVSHSHMLVLGFVGGIVCVNRIWPNSMTTQDDYRQSETDMSASGASFEPIQGSNDIVNARVVMSSSIQSD